ncbi:MAG TPA: hypothetical protein VK190_04405 [Pseudoneobacillus sp.]|nr:hypothetical protein [Pseudoneobacillus sp.]
MASKKFSRLSIQLVAQNKMSKPMAQAAQSSQRLQNSVNRLSGQLNQTQGVVSRFTQSFGNAARSIGGFSQALYKVTRDSALAYVAGKVLTGTYKLLSNAAVNAAFAIGNLAGKLGKFIASTRGFQLMAATVKNVGNAFKLMGQSINSAIKNSKAFKILDMAVASLKNTVSQTGLVFLNMGRGALNAAKSSKTYIGLKMAIQGVQKQAQSAVLAFTLWKNSSVFVQKLSNDFRVLGNAVSAVGRAAGKLLTPFQLLKQNIANMNRGLQQVGGRRSTFNQLADANARLNKEINKLNKELSKADSKLGKIGEHVGGMHAMGMAFGAYYAGQEAFGAAKGAVQGTVGNAMQQDYSEKSVGILAGAENGAKYWKQIQDYAASTAYASSDWATNMRSAIKNSKNTDDLKKYQQAMEQLATLDPVQGLEGAALAIREMNSGDITSLVERFELPRTAMKKLKDIQDPIKQVEALMKAVGDSTGYTVENINKMKELPLMQWQKFTNTVKNAFGQIGKGALTVIGPALEKINKAFTSGKFQPYIDSMAKGLGEVAQKVLDFGTKLASMDTSGIMAKLQPYIDLFNKIKGTVQQAWPTIKDIFSNMSSIAGKVATEISNQWPKANTVIQTLLDVIKDVSGWVNDHFPTVISLTYGLGAAIGAFMVAEKVAAAWGLLTTAIKLYREGTLLATIAQWAMNTAILANPYVAVAAAIIGLGVALYEAYQHSETFRNAVQAAMGWLKEKGIQALELGKEAVSGIKKAFSELSDMIEHAWGKLTGFVKDLGNAQFGLPKWMGGNGLIQMPSPDGSHKGGLNYVPYDGYTAKLHRGEEVLTADEAKKRRQGELAGVTVTGNTFIVRQDSDIDAIAEALVTKLYDAKLAMG